MSALKQHGLSHGQCQCGHERLMITALPARELINGISGELKTSPQKMESPFGHEAVKSDYNFVKMVYEFTPDTMHHWSISSRVFFSRGNPPCPQVPGTGEIRRDWNLQGAEPKLQGFSRAMHRAESTELWSISIRTMAASR